MQKEAERRGLLNLRSTVDAIPLLKSEKNIAMFEKHKVLNRTEINSRVDIILENYAKIIHIEALTLIDIGTLHKESSYLNFNIWHV